MSDQNKIDDTLGVMNKLSADNYNNKFFRNRPIADSRETALMDVDVEKFLGQKYDQDITEKEDEYVFFFLDRLMNRVFNLNKW